MPPLTSIATLCSMPSSSANNSSRPPGAQRGLLPPRLEIVQRKSPWANVETKISGRLLVVGNIRGQDLERHLAFQLEILHAIDLAHSAGDDGRDNLV
jgi:hypothetical protein